MAAGNGTTNTVSQISVSTQIAQLEYMLVNSPKTASFLDIFNASIPDNPQTQQYFSSTVKPSNNFTPNAIFETSSAIASIISSNADYDYDSNWTLSNLNSSLDTSGETRSTLEVAIISFLVVLLSLMTAGGNLLVIWAFKIDRRLQTVSNYFLLSLAVADISIGVVSMPFYTVYLLMDHWPLGTLLCDIWLSLDYTMSNASVANLIIISFDRYLSVTRPLTYRAKRTPKRAGWMIGCAWVISALMWTPWIFAWPYIEGKRTVPENDCYIQFLKTNQYITIITCMAAFYVPVSIMTIIYYRIYRETRKRQKDLAGLQGGKEGKGSKGSKKSTLSSDEEGYSSLSEKRSPSTELGNSIKHKNACKKKFFSCLKIDRDSDYAEESSSSDQTASPGNANIIVSESHEYIPVNTNVNKRVTPSNHIHQTSIKRGKHNDQMCISGSLIPLLPVETPLSSPTPSSCHDITTSFSRQTDLSSIPLAEEDDDVIEEEKDKMYTVFIKLPPSDIEDQQPSIRLVPDSDVDSICDTGHHRTHDDSDSSDDCHPDLNDEDDDDEEEDRNRIVPPVRPPTGTPAMARRAHSNDTARVAMQAKMAAKVANKVRKQRAHHKLHSKRHERRQDQKAAKTLTAILLAFIITWTPYNIFTIVEAYCTGCINETLYAIGYWLCYINSTINPLCYALCNANFRRAFWRILTCRFSAERRPALHRMMMPQINPANFLPR
ncbi:hypothetical protein SNE40_010460 [Patella caerulea]|uniref:G-protein coupled receptors family 1 profile domain-containing protein n=2 Tax=Patella caerulea TaxID=87958 RepID=A0AAN8JV77_PATCE